MSGSFFEVRSTSVVQLFPPAKHSEGRRGN
jgi:hypothetical protein